MIVTDVGLSVLRRFLLPKSSMMKVAFAAMKSFIFLSLRLPF